MGGPCLLITTRLATAPRFRESLKGEMDTHVCTEIAKDLGYWVGQKMDVCTEIAKDLGFRVGQKMEGKTKTGQKMEGKTKTRCVCRESNPGLLLGRQLS